MLLCNWSIAQDTLSKIFLHPFNLLSNANGTDIYLKNDTLTVFGEIIVCDTCLNHTRQYSTQFNMQLENISDWQLIETEDMVVNMSNGFYPHQTFRNSNNQIVGLINRWSLANTNENINILYHFNSQGIALSRDTIWELSRPYQDSIYESLRGLQDEDGNYVWVGSTFLNNGDYPSGFCTKITPEGELLWVHEYANTWELISIQNALGGGYWLMGWETGPEMIDPCDNYDYHDSQMILIKTDADGIELKRIGMGSIGPDYAFNIHEEEDRIVVLGRWSLDELPSEFPQEYCDVGTLFSQVLHETADGFEIGDFKRYMIPDGYLYFQGSFKMEDQYYLYGFISDEPGTPYHKGILLNLDENLDSLSCRKWWHFDSAGSRNYVNQIIPLPDGSGFVGCGSVFNDIFDPIPLLEQLWLFKLDSLGCLIPGCDVGIEEMVMGLVNYITVFPNPASTFTTVQLEIPIDFRINLENENRLVITNLQGKQVKTISLPTLRNGQTHTEQIDVRGLASGLYHVHWAVGTTWLGGVALQVVKE